MPSQARPSRDRPQANSRSTSTPATVAHNTLTTTVPAWDDYAAGDEAEIAAHFPVPSSDIADRLLGLLLPRDLNQLNGESAA
jgi:hypothetical protein